MDLVRVDVCVWYGIWLFVLHVPSQAASAMCLCDCALQVHASTTRPLLLHA